MNEITYGWLFLYKCLTPVISDSDGMCGAHLLYLLRKRVVLAKINSQGLFSQFTTISCTNMGLHVTNSCHVAANIQDNKSTGFWYSENSSCKASFEKMCILLILSDHETVFTKLSLEILMLAFIHPFIHLSTFIKCILLGLWSLRLKIIRFLIQCVFL